jgi:hypothetical protein
MLCQCGSGRSFERCHGDPRNGFARVQALAEARQLALLFPSVRLSSAPVLAFAERVAAELGEADELPADVLDEGLRLVGESERSLLVESWRHDFPDRWASVVHTAADEQAVLREVTLGALEIAVATCAATPPELVAAVDSSGFPAGAALAFVLPPPYVWSYNDARAAALAGDDGIDEMAAALMRSEHEERVRELSASVERELPFAGFRVASELLAEACRATREDLQFLRGVLTLVLYAYVRELELAPYVASRN